MSWRWRHYHEYYPRSHPRAAKGGIKAQSRRGGFGESWWAKRWIETLEGFNIGARLNRGRSYARRGQVLSIAVEEGRVRAKVQGSRPKPYDIVIAIKPLPAAAWKKLAKELSRQALFAAKLLAGEMPQDIEQVFDEVGLSLFPRRSRDLKTDCSCPDWSNPCKHIAAVYYLLGEEFDRDPFLIFKLRGITREKLSALIGVPGSRKARGRGAASVAAEQGRVTVAPAEPLPTDPEAFWGRIASEQEMPEAVEIPSVSAVLIKRLGKFPLWRGEPHFLSEMEAIYSKASPAAMAVFLGEPRLTE